MACAAVASTEGVLLSSPDGETTTLLSHDESPLSALTVGAGLVCCGDRRGDVRAWTLHSLQALALLGTRHEGAVSALQVVGSDRPLLFSASTDGIKVWDVRGGRGGSAGGSCTAMLTQHAAPVSCLAVTQGMLASASSDGELRFWELASLTCVVAVRWAHAAPIEALAALPHDLLASACQGGRVHLWRVEGSHLDDEARVAVRVACLEAHDDWITSLQPLPEPPPPSSHGGWGGGGGDDELDDERHPDARPPPLLASAGLDMCVALWARSPHRRRGDDHESRAWQPTRLRGHEQPISCLCALQPSGGPGARDAGAGLLASADWGGHVRVWDTMCAGGAGGACVRQLSPPQLGWIAWLSATPRGGLLCADADGEALLLRAPDVLPQAVVLDLQPPERPRSPPGPGERFPAEYYNSPQRRHQHTSPARASPGGAAGGAAAGAVSSPFRRADRAPLECIAPLASLAALEAVATSAAAAAAAAQDGGGGGGGDAGVRMGGGIELERSPLPTEPDGFAAALELAPHLALARGNGDVELWHLRVAGRTARAVRPSWAGTLPGSSLSMASGGDARGSGGSSGGASPVSVCAMQPLGVGAEHARLLCTANGTSTLLLWGLRHRSVVRSLAVPMGIDGARGGGGGGVTRLASLRGQLACAAHDGSLIILDPEAGESVATLRDHAPAGLLSRGGAAGAAAAAAGTSDGEQLLAYGGGADEGCCGVHACERSGLLLSVAAGRPLSVWDPRAATPLVRSFRLPASSGRRFTCAATEVAPAVNGSGADALIVSGDTAGGVQVWDLRGGGGTGTGRGGRGGGGGGDDVCVAELVEAASPNGRATRPAAAAQPVRALGFANGLAACAADGAGLRLWSQPWVPRGAPPPAEWPCVARIPFTGLSQCTSIAAQASHLICGHKDGAVSLWDLATTTSRGRTNADSGAVSSWRYQLEIATLHG